MTTSDDDLLSAPLPTRPRRRVMTGAGAVFGAVAIGALGFLGGVHVQKSQGSTATPGRMGGFAGAGGAGGGFQPGQGQQQTTGEATVGEVSSVDGSTFYVEDASGNTVRVRADKKAKVSRNAVAEAEAIHPGDTVVVTGRTASSGTVVATSVEATASNADQ